ncbi:MAG: hypothetical protein H6717_10545 [Polyangiaceae bacterium]|nr:hypothetical protein [Polyangiaceae bacterium]
MRWVEGLVAASCVACAADPPPRTPTPAPIPRVAPKKKKEAPECGLAPRVRESEPVLTLVDAGAEPRRELRFVGTVGERVSLDMAEEATLSAAPAPVLVRFSVDAQVTAVKDGITRLSLGLGNLEVPEREGVPVGFYEGVRQALGPTSGVRGEAQVDPGGPVLVELSEGEDSGLGRKLRTNLLRFAVAVPREPVGVGAKWEVKSETEMGLHLDAVTRFELTELAGTGATVKVHSSVRSTGTAPAICAAPAVVVEPMTFTMTGERTVSFDTRRPLALSGRQVVDTVIENRVWRHGTPTDRTERVHVQLTTTVRRSSP